MTNIVKLRQRVRQGKRSLKVIKRSSDLNLCLKLKFGFHLTSQKIFHGLLAKAYLPQAGEC